MNVTPYFNAKVIHIFHKPFSKPNKDRIFVDKSKSINTGKLKYEK
jgi:hypothetical protein